MQFFIQMQEETLKPVRILYMRRTGAYGAENAALMQRWKEWLEGHGLFDEDSVILAIPMDDPTLTKPDQCRYDVSIIAKEIQAEGEGIFCRELPGGKYVVFLIEHTAQAFKAAWSGYFEELQRNGYHLDNSRPVMERYAKHLVKRHLCELCVPVEMDLSALTM